MDDKLSIREDGLVSLVENRDLSDIIKPLTREIHLFDTFIAGTTHLEDKSVLDGIEAGDRLVLRREDNKFDSNAILVLNEEGRKMGYMPESDNVIFARLMDAGKLLAGKIAAVKRKGSFTQISIGIYLVDF